MAAQQLKPFLYRYYNGVIYRCKRETWGKSTIARYSAYSLPLGTTIEQFAPGYEKVEISTWPNSLEFDVKLADLKDCAIFYPSKTACKIGAGRVLSEMLKDPNADKNAIHEQIRELKNIKTR